MSRLSFSSLCWTLCLPMATAYGQVFDFSPFSPLTIPDATESGTFSKGSIAPSVGGTVGHITVDLNLQGIKPGGGFTGDLYIALYHGGKATVLLNRPGRDGGNPFGYDDNGDIHITFDDSASHDVHVYQNSTGALPGVGLTGQWQPDGRTTNFKSVSSSDPRTAMLDQFLGTPIRGDWVLFMADVGGGGITQLNGWSLSIIPVPESEAMAPVISGLLASWAFSRRMRSRGPTKSATALGSSTAEVSKHFPPAE